MYNHHSYAITIEKILHTSLHTADEIERDPLAYLESFLDKVYKEDETKAKLIDLFDKKYAKYKSTHLCNWSEEDAKQMTNDLRKICSR